MLQKLLYPLFRGVVKETYRAGLRKGYELGTLNGICKERNRALITGANVEKQVQEIVERSGI
jgi:hypothetical protein